MFCVDKDERRVSDRDSEINPIKIRSSPKTLERRAARTPDIPGFPVIAKSLTHEPLIDRGLDEGRWDRETSRFETSSSIVDIENCRIIHMRALFIFAFLFALVESMQAYGGEMLSSPLQDDAHLLNAEQALAVEKSLNNLRSKKDIWLVVKTIPRLDGETIEEYSNKYFHLFQIGSRESDNGLLLVIAAKDRRVRLEVGYGLEGDIPDITAQRILDDQVIPILKNDDYFQGISHLISYLQSSSFKPLKRIAGDSSRQNWPVYFGLSICLVIVGSYFRRTYARMNTLNNELWTWLSEAPNSRKLVPWVTNTPLALTTLSCLVILGLDLIVSLYAIKGRDRGSLFIDLIGFGFFIPGLLYFFCSRATAALILIFEPLIRITLLRNHPELRKLLSSRRGRDGKPMTAAEYWLGAGTSNTSGTFGASFSGGGGSGGGGASGSF